MRKPQKKTFAEFGEVAGRGGHGRDADRRPDRSEAASPQLEVDHAKPSRELRSKIHQFDGNELNRVQMKVYDLDDEAEFLEFARGTTARSRSTARIAT